MSFKFSLHTLILDFRGTKFEWYKALVETHLHRLSLYFSYQQTIASSVYDRKKTTSSTNQQKLIICPTHRCASTLTWTNVFMCLSISISIIENTSIDSCRVKKFDLSLSLTLSLRCRPVGMIFDMVVADRISDRSPCKEMISFACIRIEVSRNIGWFRTTVSRSRQLTIGRIFWQVVLSLTIYLIEWRYLQRKTMKKG